MGPSTVPTERILEWPSSLGSGMVRKLDGLFWDNVDHLSALGIRGTTTGRATAPAVTTHIGEIFAGETVFDLVTLEGAGVGTTHKRDAVLMSVAGSEELRVAYIDENDDEQVLPFDHPGWARSTALTASTDLFGVDIAARSGNRRTLLRTRYDFATGDFTQQPSVSMSEAIVDLCLVHFDSDLVVDTVVLTSAELLIYNTGGALLFSHTLSHAGGAVAPVPEASMRRAIALLERNANDDGWQLLHITEGTIESPVAITIDAADFDLVGMSAGDADGDSDFDVAIQAVGASTVLLRNNAGSSQHFDLEDSSVMVAGDPTNQQWPASMRDYDYDGQADLLVPVLSSNGTRSLVLKSGLGSSIENAMQSFEDVFMQSWHEIPGTTGWSSDNRLNMGLDIPDSLVVYDTVTVTFYSGDENSLLGGGWAQQFGDPVSYSVPSQPGVLIVSELMPVDRIDHPQLLFAKVQFTQVGNKRTKPTFLAGATINDGQGWGESCWLRNGTLYLNSNQLPQSSLHQVKRHHPTNGNIGRQQIGVISPQKSLPFF